MSVPQKTVFIIYYSMYGHIGKLAQEASKGVEKAGVKARLFQVQETLPSEILQKMHAPPKAAEVPIITPQLLPEADGILFGMPTRFGSVPAQMKAFFDSCGQLWVSGALSNKFVGTFFSTGSVAGGQESTTISCMPFFAHMGMAYVPLGYKFKPLGELSAHGGSPWGAGTIAGPDGSRQPSQLELDAAAFQGFDFASLVKRVN